MTENTILTPDTIADLAQRVVEALILQGKTLSCAESCTGGLLAAVLTDVAGCSAVFPGSFVTYSDEIKHRVLGVRRKSLKLHSAVSPQVAAEMAVGARERLGVDFALSLTGYAGPDGGTEEDPVGTVYVGISTLERTRVRRYSAPLGADRAAVRAGAVLCALQMLTEAIKSEESRLQGSEADSEK